MVVPLLYKIMSKAEDEIRFCGEDVLQHPYDISEDMMVMTNNFKL
jgi:hypothetical protein